MTTEYEKNPEHMENVRAEAKRVLQRAETAKDELTDMRKEIACNQNTDIFEDIEIPNIQSIATRLHQMEAEAAPLAAKEKAAWETVSESQKKAADAAAFMNSKEQALNLVCQKLSHNQKHLNSLEYWHSEAHRIAKQKAFTLAAAQKEAEDAYKTLNKAGENLETAKIQVEADFESMETSTAELSRACEQWQIAYDTWSDAKAEAEKNAAALNSIRKEIEQLLDDQEKAKTQAAEAVAQLALNSLKQNKGLQDIDIQHVPAHNYTPLSPQAAAAPTPTNDLKPQPMPKTVVYEPENEEPFEQTEAFVPVKAKPDFWQNSEQSEPAAQNFSNPKLAAALATENAVPVKKRNSFLGYLLCILLAVALALVIRTWGFQVTHVIGDSMEPTLHTDNRVLTSHITYMIAEPERKDIITFPSPDTTDNVPYIKRIIGISGDHIKISEGNVYVNDTLLEEPYLDGAETFGDIDTIVPEGYVFVMGDNRMVSHDSRDPSVGFIDESTILGKAVFRVYPFSEWGAVE